jgi:5-hydroxyisourate hydrolase
MISTHVLDTTRGSPAEGIKVILEKKEAASWKQLASGTTNSDGRHVFDIAKESGTFQLKFEIEDYFKKNGSDYFFPSANVIFVIHNTSRKYHVPLLLNPFSYSTYRGS